MNKQNEGTANPKSKTLGGALRCRDFTQTGILDAGECCELCHSAERYALVEALGPCRAVLADGREAFVCCVARKQLLSL